MQIIFAVVLRMSIALGYEFDECVSTSRITTDYFLHTLQSLSKMLQINSLYRVIQIGIRAPISFLF
jgi:hypothetical protein